MVEAWLSCEGCALVAYLDRHTEGLTSNTSGSPRKPLQHAAQLLLPGVWLVSEVVRLKVQLMLHLRSIHKFCCWAFETCQHHP